MQRRQFIEQGALALLGASSLAGCMRPRPQSTLASALAPPSFDPIRPLVPIRAREGRIFKTTVCLRPFRAAGPRLEAEKIGDTLVVHNYGHGGSGWSLSWGSSSLAVEIALAGAGGAREIAVIGCDALGLTSAILLQRTGVRVTIYAKELPPEVRSSRATGSWTPDSRVALASAASPEFAARWERMARVSYSMYQDYLGLAGDPVEWTDRYALGDLDGESPRVRREASEPLEFASYMPRISDITPRGERLPPHSLGFPAQSISRSSSMTFNVTAYARLLYSDFLLAGGKIERREFQEPADVASLAQKVIINCTGYGSRQLWRDESIIPVRGQIAWLIPQPDVSYGLYFRGLNVLARRDGIVVQLSQQGEATGWNDDREVPDHAEAVAGVRMLADLYDRMQPPTRQS